jgi:hypothetical protein
MNTKKRCNDIEDRSRALGLKCQPEFANPAIACIESD